MRPDLTTELPVTSPAAYAALVPALPSSTPGAPPHTLWSISPLAAAHLSLDKVLLHQKWLIQAGAAHTVLITDVHAALCPDADPFRIEQQARCYEHYLSQICGLAATIVRGSAFQRSPTYQLQLARLLDRDTDTNAGNNPRTKAAAMQILDPCFLSIDAVMLDQETLLPRPAHRHQTGDGPAPIYTPPLYSTTGRPLRESTPDARIFIHDSQHELARKIKQMYAPPADHTLAQGSVNAVLEYFRWSVFPWVTDAVPVHLTDGGYGFFTSYDDLETAYAAGQIHPSDAKTALLLMLTARLQTIQAHLPDTPSDADR
ncbi:Tyrosyl-tRNA synthetase |uniref:tyrosine--tRNA ligase n=2 Tax=Nonomuraea TaxID=83681 RepID=A0A1U9ZYM0_9ACTN|nr:hypothetical protein BKM31_17710 [Nonomuraea sp. ATCC 55076]SPL98675.1 Tyrosyl-tRNA synthetase \